MFLRPPSGQVTPERRVLKCGQLQPPEVLVWFRSRSFGSSGGV